MSDELRVTEAGGIIRATRLVRLPVPQGGVEIVVRVGAVPKLAIVEALDGIPGVGAAPGASWEGARDTVRASIKPELRVAELGLVEPAFSFAEREEGRAFWDDLLMENQAFVVAQILDISGWGGGKAKEADGFPAGAPGERPARGSDVPGGRGDGDVVPDAGPAAA